MTEPRYRFFARADLEGGAVCEFPSFDAIEARGGAGDELTYYPALDAFEADDAIDLIPNPVAGDPLAGARALTERLEATARWGQVGERDD